MTAARPLAALALLAPALLCGCAPSTPTTRPAQDTGGMAASSRGTIVAMRGNSLRGPILGTIRQALNVSETAPDQSRAVEFIVQEDGAATPISIVQTNDDNLRPGDPILLTRGARSRIARAGG